MFLKKDFIFFNFQRIFKQIKLLKYKLKKRKRFRKKYVLYFFTKIIKYKQKNLTYNIIKQFKKLSKYPITIDLLNKRRIITKRKHSQPYFFTNMLKSKTYDLSTITDMYLSHNLQYLNTSLKQNVYPQFNWYKTIKKFHKFSKSKSLKFKLSQTIQKSPIILKNLNLNLNKLTLKFKHKYSKKNKFCSNL